MTTADATRFWAQHDGGASWCALYRGSDVDPSRAAVLAAVRQFENARSVLEVGCHCGPLLKQLAALPGIAHAVGYDVNAAALQAAKADGLIVRHGAVPHVLDGLRDGAFDLVVSSYCLAYVAPADLVRTLAGCLRVARMGVVLAEPSAGPGVRAQAHEDGEYAEWRHEYMDALEEAAGARMVRLTRTRLETESNINALIVARHQWQN